MFIHLHKIFFDQKIFKFSTQQEGALPIVLGTPTDQNIKDMSDHF